MMTQNDEVHITKRRVVYAPPGIEAVIVQRDIAFSAESTLTMDIYYPADRRTGVRLPAVVLAAGYPDEGYERVVGCRFKDMRWCVSWGELLAVSGMIAVTYANRTPTADIQALLEHIRKNALRLGIDENRIGLLASSGNAPLGLSTLMERGNQLKCGVFCYSFLLDLDGATAVAEASRRFGFVNPCVGKSIDDIPSAIPLLLVRGGRDQMPGLNESIDRFIARALERNLPVTLVNDPDAPHAFDLFQDDETSRHFIRQMLEFMKFRLAV
jgi:pimeloyl-ACP methyl ester carboxylesterase